LLSTFISVASRSLWFLAESGLIFPVQFMSGLNTALWILYVVSLLMYLFIHLCRSNSLLPY
jgi:hypothetical protein